ncbi:MAG: alpha/beta hydrolase, partial [Ignavibacteriae bacterium HGW-Ignavibacteriae-3]
MVKAILIIICIFNQLLIAQEERNAYRIPVDTSFTLFSAFQKTIKDFPSARIVDENLQPKVLEKKNIVYCSIKERKLHLDLFSPADLNQKLPGIILIHGGGWRSGNRSMEIPMARQLAANGFVTAVVEYRLSPECKYPSAIFDLKSSVRWMRANSEELNIDSTRIALYGVSSGGHLAAMLGATNGIDKFEGTSGNLNHS